MRSWLCCAIMLAAQGCASSSSNVICRPDAISGAERCQYSGGAADAALTGGVAAGVWAVKGCAANGCEPPFTCNAKTKLCERLTCSENESCPPGYECHDQHCR